MRLNVMSNIYHFNSQPHKEADGEQISCSAPCVPDFNSQPHKEADVQDTFLCRYTIFQLTASQGG